MDFKQLETFVSIAKYKSFSKTAKELFLTQPTISTHIQNLEKELGTVLINRNNKNISLTKAGEILYNHALEILNCKKKALYDLGEYEGKIEGLIEISASSIPISYIVPNIISDFNKIFPQVKFNISNYASNDVIDEILDEKIDFGFVGNKITSPRIEYIELCEDDIVLISGVNKIIPSTNGYVSIEDIKDYPFIMRKEGSGTKKIISKELHKKDISLNIISHTESLTSIKQMVRHGIGLSIVSMKCIEDELKYKLLNAYTISDLNLKRKFYFAFSKKKVPTPIEEKFIDFIREYSFKDFS